MKTKTITLYEYSELTSKSKEKALQQWNENNDDPLMQSHMLNLLKEKLEERGINYDTDSMDVRYSLSSCQGDGFMFIGEITWGKYTMYIRHDNSNYYHSHTARIEIQETDNLGFHVSYENKDVVAFVRIYHSICKEMEEIGYREIEHTQSEESFIEACDANEYTFRKDGTMENIITPACPKEFYLVTYHDGEKDDWDTTVAESSEEAEQNIIERYKKEMEIDLEPRYIKVYAQTKCDGYNVRLEKE